ncbi:MAG: hypothetical protein IPL39_16635 [Opitutaceae bacterium]|nr:hypothetical protein [Opitutaceae bacterium]
MNAPLPPEPDPVSVAEERRLQQVFRDGAADYLDDAGFTARVLGRLPAARRQRERRRWLLLGTAVLLGGAVAGVFGGHDLAAALSAGWSWAAEWSVRPIPRMETLATAGSLVVLIGALAVAWWSRREV